MKNRNSIFYIKHGEKGAITLFILLAILFFLIILIGLFYNLSNRNMTQDSEIENIKKNYNDNKNLTEINEIYDQTVEDLRSSLKITLNNQSATNPGTEEIFQNTGKGIYLDKEQKEQMTLDSNTINVPKKEYIVTYNYNYEGQPNTQATFSYIFKGYYTERDGRYTNDI